MKKLILVLLGLASSSAFAASGVLYPEVVCANGAFVAGSGPGYWAIEVRDPAFIGQVTQRQSDSGLQLYATVTRGPDWQVNELMFQFNQKAADGSYQSMGYLATDPGHFPEGLTTQTTWNDPSHKAITLQVYGYRDVSTGNPDAGPVKVFSPLMSYGFSDCAAPAKK